MAYKKINKVIYLDDEEYVWCSKEKDYVKAEEFEFTVNGNYKHWCEKCDMGMDPDLKMKHIYAAKARKDFDKEQAMILLRNIGYQTEGDISIYQQFLLRHNLEK